MLTPLSTFTREIAVQDRSHLPSSTIMSPVFPLPPELVALCISRLGRDIDTLISGALVASAWTQPCQKSLFSILTIRRRQSWHGLLVLLRTSGHLRPYISHLRFVGVQLHSTDVSDMDIGFLPAISHVSFLYTSSISFDVLRLLPSLVSLETNSVFSTARQKFIAFNSAAASGFKSLKIRNLNIHTDDRGVRALLEWLQMTSTCAAQSLKYLSISCGPTLGDYDEHGRSWLSQALALHPKLKYMELRLNDSSLNTTKGRIFISMIPTFQYV